VHEKHDSGGCCRRADRRSCLRAEGHVDSDPAAPFGGYKTYAWVAGTAAPNPLNEDRLHASVDARLSARGLGMNTTTPEMFAKFPIGVQATR